MMPGPCCCLAQVLLRARSCCTDYTDPMPVCMHQRQVWQCSAASTYAHNVPHSRPKERRHSHTKLCPALFPRLQDRTLQQEQQGAWNKAYYMPTSADRAVAAARKWIDSVGAGGPYAAAQPGSGRGRQPQLVVDVSRQQLLDRYSQHTQHCPHCKAGLKQLERKAGMAQVAAAVMFVVLCGTVGTVGVPGLLAGGGGSVVGVAAVVGMAVCAAVMASAKKWLKQFAFVDFVHADNH